MVQIIMGRANYLQNNFTAGEVSPRIDARADLTRYKNGVKILQNMVIFPQGGATSRTGTVHVTEVKDSSKQVDLLDFQFSTEQAYIIETGDLYMRFFRNNGQVLETAKTITGITQDNPAVVTSASHGFTTGQHVIISGVVGMTEVNGKRFTVGSTTTNTFELSGINSTSFGAYVSGGEVSRVYELTTPYTESQISDISKTQSADVMFIAHGSHSPRELSRTSDTNWTINATDFVDGPYLPQNTTGTISLSGTSGTVTVTSTESIFSPTDTTGTGGTGSTDRTIRLQNRGSDKTITNITQASPAVVTSTNHDLKDGDTVYISGVVGMTEVNGKTFEVANKEDNTFELKDTDSSSYTAYTSGGKINRIEIDWKWLKITGYTSGTVVTAEFQDDQTVGTTGPFDTFRLGAWSDTTGYPEEVTFFENRLIYARTKTQPDTLWASAVDDYNKFAPGTEDDDSYEYTVVAEQVNAIQWLSPQKTLRIGTTGAEFSMSGGSTTAAVTPTNVRITRETSFGSKAVTPLLIENVTLFWQKAGRKLREFVYSFEVDNFVAPDITLINESISKSGITKMTYQAEPDSVVWAVREDGILIGMTYMRDQDVVGWHRHLLGGTDTKVKSVASIPIATQDQVWMVVSRTIDGGTKQYIERLGDTFIDKTVNDAVFVDSSLSFNGITRSATLIPGATSGDSVTFTASSSVFTADDVGREIRNGEGKAEILSQAGTTVVAKILVPFESTATIPSGEWTLSANIINGLSHLEGQVVDILGDGGVHEQRTVTNGSITLDGQYTYVHVGLGYRRIIETLDIDAGSPLGTAQGSRGRITTVSLRLLESVGLKLGKDLASLTQIDFRRPSDVQDEGVPLFTGFKRIKPKHGWDETVSLTIVQDQPLPLTVLGMTIKIQVSDAP